MNNLMAFDVYITEDQAAAIIPMIGLEKVLTLGGVSLGVYAVERVVELPFKGYVSARIIYIREAKAEEHQVTADIKPATESASVPPYVWALIEAMKTGKPLDFEGTEVPQSVQDALALFIRPVRGPGREQRD